MIIIRKMIIVGAILAPICAEAAAFPANLFGEYAGAEQICPQSASAHAEWIPGLRISAKTIEYEEAMVCKPISVVDLHGSYKITERCFEEGNEGVRSESFRFVDGRLVVSGTGYSDTYRKCGPPSHR